MQSDAGAKTFDLIAVMNLNCACRARWNGEHVDLHAWHDGALHYHIENRAADGELEIERVA